METFPEIPLKWTNEKLFQKWDKLKIISNVANAAIEIKRSRKDIGSTLEADVVIYLSKQYLELVKNIDLSEHFIKVDRQRYVREELNWYDGEKLWFYKN